MPRIAIITNVIPQYRGDLFKSVAARYGAQLVIYCQDKIAGVQIKLAHKHLVDNVKIVRFWSLPREYLVWQRLPFRHLYHNFDILIFAGNPRFLSTVVFATFLLLKGKKVVIWGQWHTAGANPVTERLRLSWWRLFNHLLLYTDRGVEHLRERGFRRQTLIGLNNGLNQNVIEIAKARWSQSSLLDWRIANNLQGRKIFLSCARFEPKNCFDQVAAALRHIVAKDNSVLWCVIGDGPEAEKLRASCRELGDHVLWLGSVYDEEQLAPWFMSATAMVHPGAIGLSLLHAYGYGLPVITHTSELDHMPEIAAMPSINKSICFPRGDINSLADRMLWAASNPVEISAISAAVQNIAWTEYNTDIMAMRFFSMIDLIKTAHPFSDAAQGSQLPVPAQSTEGMDK